MFFFNPGFLLGIFSNGKSKIKMYAFALLFAYLLPLSMFMQ